MTNAENFRIEAETFCQVFMDSNIDHGSSWTHRQLIAADNLVKAYLRIRTAEKNDDKQTPLFV